jgi:hypothetical protein
MSHNDPMVNVESLAVSAVGDIIARCPRLTAEIASNDKTPFTDGQFDVYNSDKKNKGTFRGRIPIQVKGRTHPGKIKKSAETIPFPIDVETLQFFLDDGGGLYFYVPVSPEGYAKGVFFRSLAPFRVARLLDGMKPGQKKLSVKLQRFPTEPAQVQGIVNLALEARKQGRSTVNLDEIMSQLTGITLHTQLQISDEHPTVLHLEDTDFSVQVTTAGGSVIPVDVDLVIYPGEYEPHRPEIAISCGSAEYMSPLFQQLDSSRSRITLSPGLAIRAKKGPEGLQTHIDLSSTGTIFDRLKDINFFLAAAAGSPLVIGGREMPPLKPKKKQMPGLEFARDRLLEMVAVIDGFELGPELSRSVHATGEEAQYLTMLYHAFVAGKEVELAVDGIGRMNLDFGDDIVVALVSNGQDGDHKKIIDPFDPIHRGEYKLVRQGVGGAIEEIHWATIYESLHDEELGRVLNLHVDRIADAYDALQDRGVALSIGNQMVLKLLAAADSAGDAKRTYLLRGARNLADWLVLKGDGNATNQINRWQTRKRTGDLGAVDERDMRLTRRAVRNAGGEDAHLQEACLTILLEEFDELEVMIADMPETDTNRLRSWPIWSLAPRPSAVAPR